MLQNKFGSFKSVKSPGTKEKTFVVRVRFKKYNKKLEELTWSANWPHLNPVECLWDRVHKQWRSAERLHLTALDLKDLLLSSWNNENFSGLVKSASL